MNVEMLVLYIFLCSLDFSNIEGFKNGSGPCLHGTCDEVGTTKQNWSAMCQYNVTGWVSLFYLPPSIPYEG